MSDILPIQEMIDSLVGTANYFDPEPYTQEELTK